MRQNVDFIYAWFESVCLADQGLISIVFSVGFLPAGFGPIDSTPVKKPVPRRGQAHGANIPMITELGELHLLSYFIFDSSDTLEMLQKGKEQIYGTSVRSVDSFMILP